MVMATSAEILARLRQEQQWQRDNAWQQTPVPAPAPATPTPVRTPAPVQSNQRNLPAATPTIAATPMPQRNRQTPTPAAPTVQQAGQAYQKNTYDPLSSARTPTPAPAIAPRPSTTPTPNMTPSLPRPTSTPQPAATPAAQTQYRNPYPTGSMNNPAPTTRPVTQQPANRPMYGPPTQQEAAQKGSTLGRIIDRGQGIPTPPAEPAPLYNAKEVLLDYLLRTNDPEMLNRLANAAANPIQQAQPVLYDAGTPEEGYAMVNRGGPGIEEVLNAYASVPAGTPYESIWNQKPATAAGGKTMRDAILENGWTTHDPLLDYILRTSDERVLSTLRSQGWARPMLARYEQYISQPYQGA